MNLSDLASHFRLYNFFIKSGAGEDKVESFIAKINSSDSSPEKVVELLNQLYDISKEESIPIHQVSSYIQQKIEEKKKIEEELREADTLVQNKNVSIEVTNEHIHLNEELNEQGLSTQYIDKLLNLLLNAKEYGFDAKKIVGKLRSIQRLEKKENKLKNNCEILSKQIAKHKETLPLAELIEAMHIGRTELISFKIGSRAAETYNFPHSTAAFHVINNISMRVFVNIQTFVYC